MSTKRKRKTRRIYYGPPGKEKSLWWDVITRPAKKAVVVNGTALNALRGAAGSTIGCAMSNVAIGNMKAFPHKAFIASFDRSTALIVDRKRKNGTPYSAVQYEHSYKHITDANDNKTLKKMVEENPAIMEREFTLRVPRKRKHKPGKNAGGHGRDRGHGMRGVSFIPRGALARAVRAGQIPEHVAQQIEEVANATM